VEGAVAGGRVVQSRVVMVVITSGSVVGGGRRCVERLSNRERIKRKKEIIIQHHLEVRMGGLYSKRGGTQRSLTGGQKTLTSTRGRVKRP